MNQIPNIEETNIREVEELIEQLFQYYDDIDCAETVDQRITAREQAELWLKRTLHHQLQKAREEERERMFGEIEQFKSEVATMDYCDDFKDGIYATIEHILSMPVFESVLNHSELDQDVSSK